MKKAINLSAMLVDIYVLLRRAHQPLLLLWVVLMGLTATSCKKNADPQPPVITISSTNLTGTIGTKSVLEASASSNSGSTALTYLWTIKSAPPGSQAVIVNATSARAEFTPDKPGTYVLTLTVTDTSTKKSTPQDVTLIASIPGKPPVISVTQSMTIETGQKVALDGSKSSDPDVDKLTYKWVLKSKPTGSNAVLANPESAIAALTADLVGPYVVTLTISDGNWPPVSADITITAIVPAVRSINGNWTAADGVSGGTDYTPRNKFYTFEVSANNQPVSLTLTSPDINVGAILYDPLGKLINNYPRYGRSVVVDEIVNAGTYTIMIGSSQRYDIGSFRLLGRGLASEFTQIASKRVLATDVSFGAEGGGGNEYTARNHYYTFEVTADNATTDINVQSAEMSLWATLYGPSGAQIEYTYVGTPRYTIQKLNKGTYSLWVGSGTRDAIGKYTLDIFGQVQNLKQYPFDSSVQGGDYIGKNGTITYTLNVTEDNGWLDASLRSPSIAGSLTLYDPAGVKLEFSYDGNYRFITRKVNKGLHKIVVTPASNSSGLGKYTLSVYGKFADLKKQ